MDEIMKDWSFIQNIVNSKPPDEPLQQEGDAGLQYTAVSTTPSSAPTVSDPTLALVSLIFTRWKMNSSPDSIIISRNSGTFSPPSTTSSPSTPSSASPSSAPLSHSYSDSSLLRRDSNPPPLSPSPPSPTITSSHPHPASQSPVHSPPPKPPSVFSPPPPPPQIITQDHARPLPYVPQAHSSTQLHPSTARPPSMHLPSSHSESHLPSSHLSSSHSESHLPSSHSSSSSQPPTDQSHHPHFPTTSVSTFGALPPPTASSLSTSPQKHMLAHARTTELEYTPHNAQAGESNNVHVHENMPHDGHAHGQGSAAHKDVHAQENTPQKTKSARDSALDAAVVAEVIAWEKRRANLHNKVDTLNKTKTRHLEGIVNDYLEAVRGIVMNEPGLSDQIKMNMISQEYLRLEGLKETLFSTKASAIISCVDGEIKSTERAVKMKKNVTKLQALTRGYLVRKKYKPQLKARRQRTKCVRELLETERTYVRLLELLVKVFLTPLKESSTSKSPLMRKEDVAILFSNIESVLALNKELLHGLEERLANWTPTTLIGDVITRMAPYMKIYTQYVNQYNDALNTLNKYSKSPDLQEFLTKAKASPEMKSMDLASFLILPVQRIPRYVLLLQEIVKVTPPAHPDYANLQKALELIQEVARTINESKRQAENTNKVMAIQASLIFGEKPMEDLVQPHRKFRKEGALTREVDSSIEDCYLFLFSDILLITQKRKGFMEDHYHYIFKDNVHFASTTIRPIPDTRLWQHGFSLTSPSKNERFFAESAATKNDWMNAITEIIEEVKKNRQTLKVEEIPVAPEPEPTTNPPPSPTSTHSTPTPTPPSPHTPTTNPHVHSAHSHPHPHAHTPTTHQTISHQNSRKSLMLSTPLQQQQASNSTKLKQVVALYRQVLQLEGEIFVLPYQIKTLLPSITVTPQNLQELQSRVTLLSSRVAEIDHLHDDVLCLIRDEKSVITLDRLISQGMVHIDSMLKYLTATFPKEMAMSSTPSRASLRQSSNSNVVALSLPYQLMSSILSWYLSVSENWSVIMEKQV